MPKLFHLIVPTAWHNLLVQPTGCVPMGCPPVDLLRGKRALWSLVPGWPSREGRPRHVPTQVLANHPRDRGGYRSVRRQAS